MLPAEGGSQVRKMEARVRWRGVHPATSLPYQDTWVMVRDDSGWVMNGPLRAEVEALAMIKYGEGHRDSAAPRRRLPAVASQRVAGSKRSARLAELQADYNDEDLAIAAPSAPWARRRRQMRVLDD